MDYDLVSKPSGRRTRRKDELSPNAICREEFREIVKKVGRPWHNRRKRVNMKRVNALRQMGFSLRLIGKLYGLSESSMRRQVKGE